MAPETGSAETASTAIFACAIGLRLNERDGFVFEVSPFHSAIFACAIGLRLNERDGFVFEVSPSNSAIFHISRLNRPGFTGASKDRVIWSYGKESMIEQIFTGNSYACRLDGVGTSTGICQPVAGSRNGRQEYLLQYHSLE
jgi:hypothetical protein